MKWIPLLVWSSSLVGCVSGMEELDWEQAQEQQAAGPEVRVARGALGVGPCVVAVPQGGLVDLDGRVHDADGNSVDGPCLPVTRALGLAADVADDPCALRPCPDPVVDPVPPPHDKYLATVRAIAAGSTVTYNRMDATIKVPPAPPIRAGHAPLVAIFPALQSKRISNGLGSTILQPLLMWGDWGIDGLDQGWRIIALVCSHTPNPDVECSIFHSPSSIVRPGDEISFYIGLTEFLFDRERWILLVTNSADANAAQWLFYETSRSYERFSTALPLALEAYQLQDCGDLPTAVVAGPAQAWRWGSRGPLSFARDVSYVRGPKTPGWSWGARFAPPECSVFPQVLVPGFPNSPASSSPFVTIHVNVP